MRRRDDTPAQEYSGTPGAAQGHRPDNDLVVLTAIRGVQGATPERPDTGHLSLQAGTNGAAHFRTRARDQSMNKAVDLAPFKMTRKIATERRARIALIVESFPEADTVAAGNHLSLEVRQKRFGWYLVNHHGDGRLAINCKAPRGVAERLVNSAPDRFHIPKFVGHQGWVGLWLDTPDIDWTEVEAILKEAYRMTASRKLIAEIK